MITAIDAPPQIRNAFLLLWVSVLIGALEIVYSTIFPDPEFAQLTRFVVLLPLSILAVYSLVVYRASRRSNRAKWILSIWVIAGTIANITTLWGEFAWPGDISYLIGSVLDIAAIYLIFTSGGRAWYAAPHGDKGAF